MEPHQDPFATPVRTSSNFDADELDTGAIGVALTADVRRSPIPAAHHSLPTVTNPAPQDSANRRNHHGRTDTQPHPSDTPSDVSDSQGRVSINHGTNGHRTDGRENGALQTYLVEDLEPQTPPIIPVDTLAPPSRTFPRLFPRREAGMSQPEPASTDLVESQNSIASSHAEDSSSSADSRTSAIQSRSLDDITTPTTRRRNRRPPVSMHRLYNNSSTRVDPLTGPTETSHTRSSQRTTNRVLSESRWPASPRPLPGVSNENLPGITIEEATPPAEVGPENHSAMRLERPHPVSSLYSGHHTNPRRHSRHLPLLGRASTTFTSLGDELPQTRPTSSATTASETPGLLHPPRAHFAIARDPFADSFSHEAEHFNTDSDYDGANTPERVSGGRNLVSERVGFLRRLNRRLSAIGPLDNTSRNNSILEDSHAPTRRPSFASSQPNGSTRSAPPEHQRSSRAVGNGRPSFRDPFRSHSQDDAGSRQTGNRRTSESGSRRPSTARRMTSYVIPENPIPAKYRTRSVSSLAYFVAPLEKNNKTIPIFEDQIESEKENVEEFLAAVELLQSKAVRKPWQTKLFKVAYFFVILCIIYFVFVGQPLWDGLGLNFYRWINSAGIAKAGSAIFMSWAGFQAFAPMLCTRFEQEVDDVEKRDASEVALVIPAYKAAKILPETIRHALKIFKPEQIFIMANGNSPTPLDDTAEVCKEFGVNVAWVPIGSKITAEFVGVALTSKFKYILLIDDDVHLPPNLPIVTDRIQGNTKCVGYTIKSTGENGSKGTLIQQCQDMEYKLSGLTRTFCGKFGSATFPHGAIILWERATLQALFNVHPGYAISEDWFFGYAARASGHRIQFCSQVFVETETPPSLFFTSGPARGGFGEMTVFKQRFYRWNFFWSHRLWEDTIYIFFSWRLGWRELVTKLWVTVELYDCVMSFLRPWVIVMALIANYRLLLIFIAALTGMYACAFIMFNTWHLRKKKEMVAWKIMPVYMAMKFTLMWVNVVSVYYDMYCYAKYFSVKHPRVIETRAVLEAAYKARLGPDLVPLETQLGDATAAPSESEKVEAAPPLQGVLPLASVS